VIKINTLLKIIIGFLVVITLSSCKTLSLTENSSIGTDQSINKTTPIELAQLNTPATMKPQLPESYAGTSDSSIENDISLIKTQENELLIIDTQIQTILNAYSRPKLNLDDTQHNQHNNLVIKEIIEEAEIALVNENNAWTRLQRGMQMTSVLNKRVRQQMDWYLKHRGYLDRVMARAEPILPFILDELEAKGLPSEIALLPIVESAYQAFAYSHGRASGMWQIIPSTGRHCFR